MTSETTKRRLIDEICLHYLKNNNPFAADRIAKQTFISCLIKAHERPLCEDIEIYINHVAGEMSDIIMHGDGAHLLDLPEPYCELIASVKAGSINNIGFLEAMLSELEEDEKQLLDGKTEVDITFDDEFRNLLESVLLNEKGRREAKIAAICARLEITEKTNSNTPAVKMTKPKVILVNSSRPGTRK